MKSLIIDNIIFSLQKSGGISVLWYELLSRLIKENINLICLNYKNNNLFARGLSFENVKVIDKQKSLFLSIRRYLNLHLKMKEPFIFHSSYYRTCYNPNAINITTVHDFTYEYFEHGLRKWIHSWQKNRAIRNSDYIICISENTKKDLLKFLPDIDKSKIRVIYNGVSNDYFQKHNNYELNIPFEPLTYVLFVGARNDYKNFKLSVEAIAKTDLNLVIIGAPLNKDEFTFVESNLKDRNRYYCTGRISNNQLNDLYNSAYALLYPSSYEGFGIPVIEAQKAGCPVVAFNGSSIPEIIGRTPLLLQNLSVDDLIKCINLLKDASLRERIVAEGLENSKRFTWDKMYENVLTLYEEAWLNKN